MIETKNLSFSYENEDTVTKVLQNINIDIEKGEFVAVLGRNGSGKSTFAKLMNAILLPTGGKAYVCGIDTADSAKMLEIRKNVGMVFQNPDNQLVATVVEEDVAFGPENLGVEPREIRKRVDWALGAVNMSEFAAAAPHHLSGGQKQRVAIAGILAMKPKCIVLDEPTAMLDPSGRREIVKTVRRLNREMGITIVFITHYMDEAAQADRVIVMDKGEVCIDGTPENVFTDRARLKEMGLDVPQVTELMHALKKKGFCVNEKIISVEDCAAELLRVLKEDIK